MEASMGTERSGCFLFGIPAAILGTRSSPRLTAAAKMPRLDPSSVHREDLPALVRARNAAASVQKHILASPKDLSLEVREDVLHNVSRLLGAIYTLGTRLKEGRQFLETHSADGLSREKAELEMQLVGASVDEIREIKGAMTRLDERAARSGEVASVVDTLRARMVSAGDEIQALDTRLGTVLGTEDLEHELRAYQQSAELALDAFQRTWVELGPLD